MSTNYPLFHLSEDHYQAEVALSVLMCFGSDKEQAILRPDITHLRERYLKGAIDFNLFNAITEVLARYIREHGALSNILESYLGKAPKLLEGVQARLAALEKVV